MSGWPTYNLDPSEGFSDEAIEHLAGVQRQMAEYGGLYPTHHDAIAALIHQNKVIADLEQEIVNLKAKNKRLKKILRRAIK